MRQNNFHKLSVRFFLTFISIFIICNINLGNASYIPVVEKTREVFGKKISAIAGQYVGIRYEFGGDFEKSGAVDNSHLFCSIYAKAAEQSGLVFAGYMPMDMLLKNSVEIKRKDLKIGDLMVVMNGHAAMIYKFENRDKFYLIYAPAKRREVIFFNSQNVVFDVYWLKTRKG